MPQIFLLHLRTSTTYTCARRVPGAHVTCTCACWPRLRAHVELRAVDDARAAVGTRKSYTICQMVSPYEPKINTANTTPQMSARPTCCFNGLRVQALSHRGRLALSRWYARRPHSLCIWWSLQNQSQKISDVTSSWTQSTTPTTNYAWPTPWPRALIGWCGASHDVYISAIV